MRNWMRERMKRRKKKTENESEAIDNTGEQKSLVGEPRPQPIVPHRLDRLENAGYFQSNMHFQDEGGSGPRAGAILKVFLCHSSSDKPEVRKLYKRLKKDGFTPWLDEEDLIPGQSWRDEIPAAVRSCHVVVVCLSKGAITKEGYVQKEIKIALDVEEEKP